MRNKLSFIFSLLLLKITISFAQLSGTNTINPSGTNFTADPSGTPGKNYTSFTNAVNALKSYGVNSSVTFNVSSGTYTEQLNIPAITGASAINTITFQSLVLDSTAVTLTWSSKAIDTNFVLSLNGACYFDFSKMTYRATGTTYA